MVLTLWWQQLLVGLAGGIAAECLHWYVLARSGKPVPAYRKRPLYWVTTIVMVLLGGVMPLLYVSGSANALLCFHLGAATPVLIQKLLARAPRLMHAQGAATPLSFRAFIDW